MCSLLPGGFRLATATCHLVDLLLSVKATAQAAHWQNLQFNDRANPLYEIGTRSYRSQRSRSSFIAAIDSCFVLLRSGKMGRDFVTSLFRRNKWRGLGQN